MDSKLQYKIFPCKNKRPAVKNWAEAASDDVDQYRAWRAEGFTSFGIPTGPINDLFVLDLDVDKETHEPIGAPYLQTCVSESCLEILRQAPRVKTPSGGYHLYLKHFKGARNTTSKLGPGIDTRGEGGFVIAPASQTDQGVYSRLMGATPGPAPAEIRVFFSEKPKPVVATPSGPTCEEEVWAIINYIDPDCSYDDWITVLMGLHSQFKGGRPGLVLAEAWSSQGAKYKPGDIEQRWNGFEGDQVGFGTVCALAREAGADLAQIAHEHKTPAAVEAPVEPVEEEDAEVMEIEFITNFSAQHIKRREWILGTDLHRGALSLTVAPGGAGKSAMVVAEALAIATGRDLTEAPVHTPGKVLYWNCEDPKEELYRRLAGLMASHGIGPEEIEGRLALHGLDGTERLCLARVDERGRVVPTQKVKALKAAIKKAGIVALLIDPFVALASAAGIDENRNDQIEGFLAILRDIARECHIGIRLVHHAKKQPAGTVRAADQDVARGASALVAAVRVAQVLLPLNEEELNRLGVDPDHADRFVKQVDIKNNLSMANPVRIYEKTTERIVCQDDEPEWVVALVPHPISAMV